ncbi:MAG: PspC domain-containing protein [Nevskiaceae bacterium]|jgi:phage shock protein PspC (stress-responsive transcriptional regulator)|nr:PspC domain-containing protein [Nevskiaceae bacterium]
MRKVTTISLNDNAYQVDDEGYEALRAYLGAAERNLAGNPDRAEILRDLEQAIGDKCRACLGTHKTVVTQEEIQRIVEQMGPVIEPGESADSTAANASASADTSTGAQTNTGAGAAAANGARPRRLYRLQEDSMWAGVCGGLGAYFGVDPVWVRVAFILLTLFTSGLWLAVYLVMWIIVPKATTTSERAAAHGAPFQAREMMDRMKKKFC